jgi:hypothetical protein
MGLQVCLRRKIVKTKELFAKSSRIWSYGTIGGRVEGKLLCMIVRQSGEIICSTCGAARRSLIARMGFVVSQVPKSEAPGATIFRG